MATLPKYPDIKETDRAYFAGLFDGEGSVILDKFRKETNTGYSLRVAFQITYKSVLVRMQKLFGGNIHIPNMEKRKNYPSVKKLTTVYSPDNWKQLYHYQLNGKDALYFLKVIEPFCDEKKPQASLAIRYEEGKRPNTGASKRSKHETDRCEFFHQELKRLKKEQPSEDELENETDFEDDQQNLFSFVSEE